MPQKTATKSTARKSATPARRMRGNSDARDAVLRAADDARSDGLRSIQAPVGPKIATIADVKELANSLPEAFLHCRDYGHQWRMANADRTGTGKRLVRTRTMYCPSCKFNKYQTFDSTGTLIEERLDYPEGYLMKGKGRITSDTKGFIRLESIDRFVDRQTVKKSKAS